VETKHDFYEKKALNQDGRKFC